MIRSLRQDIPYAIRTFLKAPGLVVAIVVSIGLGIAANTTVFSIVNELLLKDLPAREPDRLYTLMRGKNSSLSYPDYLDFRAGTERVFDGFAAHCPLLPANMNAGGTPQRVWGQLVSGNYFQVLGLKPALGRGILPFEDEAKGRNPVVVLGYGLWQKLGGDAALVGKTIVLSGSPFTVVGVTPPGFFGADRGLAAEFWAPLAMLGQLAPEIAKDAETSRTTHWLELTGRVRSGVSREQVIAALNVINARSWAEREKDRKAPPMDMYRAGQFPGGATQLGVLISVLSVVVGLVLLIACANVANLLVARAASRQHEMGVRLAMGASRGRLIRQLMTESILLSAMGAGFGFLLAVPGTAALSRFQPPIPIPLRFDFAPDYRVLGFTTLLAVFTGILFGLAPALTGTRGSLTGAIRRTGWGGGGFRRGKLASTLVAVQVTLSLVLLVSAGLFLRSLQNAASIDIGMKPEGVLLMAVDPKGQGYDAAKAKQFFRELDARITGLPGVRSMSYVNIPPLSFAGNGNSYHDADSASGKRTDANQFLVGPRYFETMGIPLLAGRDFNPQRDEKTPVAVINRAMAKRLFGNAEPLGRHVREGDDPAGKKIYEIIGVVANSKAESLGEDEKACIFGYLPSDFDQAMTLLGVTVMVKTNGDAGGLMRAVRAQVETLDRNIPVFNLEPMTRHLEKALMLPRICAALFGIFGTIGLVLAVVGLYGVVNYSVRTRTREIGIRVALGARAATVAAMVARQGIVLVGIGLAIGLAISFALSRFTASLLYGIAPTDAVTFIGVPAVLLGASVVAILLPARRASRIEPMEALRYE